MDWGLLGPEHLAGSRRTRTLGLGAAVRRFNQLAVPGIGGVWFAKQLFLATLGVAAAGRRELRGSPSQSPKSITIHAQSCFYGRAENRSVANIIKAHAERVGLDPALFSGHSLRAGFLTSAAKRGASLFKTMATSRHRSTDTLTGYVRDKELFKDHAGAGPL